VKVTDLIAVYEHVNRSPQGTQSTFYMAIFKGEVVGGGMRPDPSEISEIKLFDELPEEELLPWWRDHYSLFEGT